MEPAPAPDHLAARTPGVTPDLLRFGWASAALDAEPELLLTWAGHPDASIRRAVMRSPRLSEPAAELVVATRRSGLHTLGANPACPRHLLAGRPAALRRHDALTRALDGRSLQDVSVDPDPERWIRLASPTLDLVLAASTHLDDDAALALATRRDRPVDPWVGALLVARSGPELRARLATRLGAEARRAVERLLEVWLLSGRAGRGSAGSARG